MKQTIDSNYIQQHLANERTFLAWLRTSLASIGVGFLIVNFHFANESRLAPITDLLAEIIGILSVVVGLFMIGFATFNYLKKKNEINEQTFRPVKNTVVLISSFMIMMIGLFFGYFLIY
ncbi:hypothetical protein CEY16_12090 [Halalkalibacillus sediminis]|uniref:DUF202 domain-containing protein n=1 Tax=Halalkalibacillus sediminis TaxID=2018042 RepID=A0A2I0QSZ7_9BACI|nr:DUF202 domain-containing protein [Halalkalibacillus sediminis]PKR77461.1 hypothetical protein CEY16_12090 [Halalkalibacillus sediminis]